MDSLATPARRHALRRPGLRAGLTPLAFIAPALAFYLMFMIVPMAGTVLLSFTNWNGYNFADIKLAGLENYQRLAADPVFWQALTHTGVFVIFAVALKTGLALFLALLLDQRLRLSGLFRAVYLVPTVLSLIVVGVLFSMILSPSLGMLNPLLGAIGLKSLVGDWLGDPTRALPVVIAIHVWATFGLYMFLFLARLLSIPKELLDAAAVDGASGFQTALRVKVPLLKATTAMVILLGAIESLKVFAIVYVTTAGGPNHASEVLSTWAFFNAFSASNVGYGSSVLVVLLAITFVVSYLQIARGQPEEDL